MYFYYDQETQLETNCSDLAAAGLLSQKCSNNKEWHLVAFYSKALQGAETYYKIYDKELLAVILKLKE